MKYISTRGGGSPCTAAEAIKAGLAPDGGLFVPEATPELGGNMPEELAPLGYQERAARILTPFLTDYTAAEIKASVLAAYGGGKFDHAAVAPLQTFGDGFSVLELWHGPTSAFKDMALQLLPHLLSQALAKTREAREVVILVATSGDTGKAALEGFRDVKQTRIVVFFPDEGVSEVQRLQMVTQEGGNVAVVAVNGNFDDAQTGVKSIFNDPGFSAELGERGFLLSSANSINWGRLVPQIVYYYSAYADLVKGGRIRSGQEVNFVVPTGNFGNILAGYYAKQMGLPVGRLICAANKNNVLTDFLRTGVYDRRREFFKTMSPSMDILISSNLERLLYYATGGDTAQVSAWMSELNASGAYRVAGTPLARIQETFWSGWADESTTAKTIRAVYEHCRYLLDPHTAVAWSVAEEYRRETSDRTPLVVVSTASPFKFNHSVLAALSGPGATRGKGEFDILRELSAATGRTVPKALATLEHKPVRHRALTDKAAMADAVRDVLHIVKDN